MPIQVKRARFFRSRAFVCCLNGHARHSRKATRAGMRFEVNLENLVVI
jgi:hypothetical protein